MHKVEDAVAREETCVEETNSGYSSSDDESPEEEQEIKVISSMLAAQPNPAAPMRLRVRLSKKENRTYLALLDTGCCTSFINATILRVNKQLSQEVKANPMKFQ